MALISSCRCSRCSMVAASCCSSPSEMPGLFSCAAPGGSMAAASRNPVIHWMEQGVVLLMYRIPDRAPGDGMPVVKGRQVDIGKGGVGFGGREIRGYIFTALGRWAATGETILVHGKEGGVDMILLKFPDTIFFHIFIFIDTAAQAAVAAKSDELADGPVR